MRFLSAVVVALALLVAPAFGQCPGGVCGYQVAAPAYTPNQVYVTPSYVPGFGNTQVYVGGGFPTYRGFYSQPHYDTGFPTGFSPTYRFAPSYVGGGSCPTCR